MAQLSLNQSLAQIVADSRAWMSLARVDAVRAHPAWGHVVDLTLQPRNVRAQARLLLLGSGDAQGVACPVAVGDEVLVAFPSGDPNAAVVIGGLPSRPRQVPEAWDNDTIRVDGGDTYDVEVHAGGTTVVVEASSGRVTIRATGRVMIESGEILLGENAVSPLVKYNELKAELDAHVHGTLIGPTSPPKPLTPAVGTNKVKGE